MALGWYGSACTYSCLFVSLMCVRMSRMFLFRNLSPLYRVMSKKVSSLSLASYVNLIVLWIEFIVFMYISNSFFVPVQIRKMSAINRFHISMCSFVIFVSIIPKNRFAYAGAIFVPIAVSCFCR